MSASASAMLLLTVLGGLALFVFGMQIMTEGLRLAVGAGLQKLLSQTTRRRSSGLLLGTALGATVHSSAAIVMLLGFVNAGLLTLGRSIAPILGANLGTTLSMQAISFRISDYLYVAIVAGVLLSVTAPSIRWRRLGQALVGFGLLFLGMETMSGAIRPYRETLATALQGIDGATAYGMFAGIGIALVLTAVWQSSGATIGIVFALIDAEVFTTLSQVYPIILGAHLGTCATGLLGSMGTNAEARRCAAAHLLFNVFNVALALLALPLFALLIPMTSASLLRQTANLHTAVMLAAVLLLLPFTDRFTRIVRRLVLPHQPVSPSSHLDYRLTDFPERAMVAVLAELQRAAEICLESLTLTAQVLLHKHTGTTLARIKTNESSLNAIKLAVQAYSDEQTSRYLSRRQIIMVHHLNQCMADIERIGDHIDRLSRESTSAPLSTLDDESIRSLIQLYNNSRKLLMLVIRSLDPSHTNFRETAEQVVLANEVYLQSSHAANELFLRNVQQHTIRAPAALYVKTYIASMDRMNRHVINIALAQKDADFRIKKSKLDRQAPRSSGTQASTRSTADLATLLHPEDTI